MMKRDPASLTWDICAVAGFSALLVVSLTCRVDGQSLEWIPTGGPYLESSLVSCGCIAAASNGRLYAGSVRANGLFASTDNGSTWTLMPLEPAPNYKAVIALTLDVHGNLLVGTGGGLYFSSHAADSLSVVGITQDCFGAVGGFANGYLIAGSGSMYSPKYVFRSTDGGQSWTETYSLHLMYPEFPIGTFNVLACSDSGYAWIGNDEMGLLRSTDYGASWRQLHNLFLPSLKALIAEERGAILAGCGRGILRSTNRGDTWALSNAGLLDTVVLSFARNRDNHIFAGTRTGVFRSTDAGRHWTEASDGIAGFAVSSLAVDEQGYAYAATQENGVMRTVGTTVSVEPCLSPVPAEVQLLQNYPNPFNPSTIIRYGLPSQTHVTLTVFNTLGQEVATPVQGVQGSGYHEVQFNGSGLAGGVYLYRLQAGDFVQTKRLVLVR